MKENNNKSIMPAEVLKALEQERDLPTGEMGQVWSLVGQQAGSNDTAPTASESEQMWSFLQAQMEPATQRPTGARADRPAVSPRRSASKIPLSLWVSAVASFSALFIMVYAFWSLPVEYEALSAEVQQFTLPDGSSVTLNSGSKLTFAPGFDGIPFTAATERRVTLEGEGFFDVVESDIPFFVDTPTATVRVLGTTFNVWARPNNGAPETTVTLASGHVEVHSDGDNPVHLSMPGHSITIADNKPRTSEPENVSLDTVLIWRNNGFAVQNESLKLVFEELERRFGISILVENADIEHDSLTILLASPGNIESILDDICTSSNLKYRKVTKGYEIYRPMQSSQ